MENKKWKIKIQSTQRDKIIEVKEYIVECSRNPLGESWAKMIEPMIYNTIIEAEEIKDDGK